VPFVVKFQSQAANVAVPADLQSLEGEQHGTNNPTATFGRLDVVLSQKHTLNVQPMYTRLTGENFNFDSPQLDTAVSANYTRRASTVQRSCPHTGASPIGPRRGAGRLHPRLQQG
jgi:hypothetical protein